MKLLRMGVSLRAAFDRSTAVTRRYSSRLGTPADARRAAMSIGDVADGVVKVTGVALARPADVLAARISQRMLVPAGSETISHSRSPQSGRSLDAQYIVLS